MAAIVDLAGRALWPVVSAVKEVGTLYSEINPATLSGAIDIIVIRQPNGDLLCSPFHVRFGKLKLFRPSEKVVELSINGKVIDIPMKVGDAGEAFFVVKAENPVPSEYATSPIVPATEPPVQDDALKSFSLAQVTTSADATAVNQVDPTLSDEMNYLHIGESESNSKSTKILEDQELNDEQEFSKEVNILEDPVPMSSSLPVDISTSKAINHRATEYLKGENLNTASSPPWSWQWGGLPERQIGFDPSREDHSSRYMKTLQNRSSTPFLRSAATPPLSTSPGMMTVNEKVGVYLSEIPASDSQSRMRTSTGDDLYIPTLMAVNQDIEDETVCQSLVGTGGGFTFDFILCSSCGPLSDLQKLSSEEAEARFSMKLLEYENICDRPELLMAPTTIYRIYGFYHSWKTAAPIIMSQVLFQKPLSIEGIRLIMKREENSVSSGWFSWGRGNKKVAALQQGLKHKASEPILGQSASMIPRASPSRSFRLLAKGEDVESQRSSSFAGSPERPRYNYAKSLRLSSDQLKTLDLKDGVNTVQFSVLSSFQGKAVCSAKMFLWNHDAKIVISDVDGTITKSDVLGHVFTMVGRDWTHAGVANLYTNISKNGYHFLYLTSRAIGQASYTREYLANVEQDQLKLPEGPVLLSPDRLVQAFTREVIQRRPQEFKMQCLKDVKRLFGIGASPFYAGFGNRITDAMSYRSVNIPSSRIFTIDPSGDVKLELLANFKTSYVKLNEIVDQVFPPTSTQDPIFSDFSFWKNDLTSIQIDVPDISIPIDSDVGENGSKQILPQQGYEENMNDDFEDAEEVSITSMDLEEHLSAMHNTKF